MKRDQIIHRALLLAASLASALTPARAEELTGPSSSQSPYLVGTQPYVDAVSVLTVGDAVNYKAEAEFWTTEKPGEV